MPKASGADKAKTLAKAKAKLKKFKKDRMNADDDNFDTQSNFSTMSTTSISQRVANMTKNKNKNTSAPSKSVQNGINGHTIPNGTINGNVSNSTNQTSNISPPLTSSSSPLPSPPVQAV